MLAAANFSSSNSRDNEYSPNSKQTQLLSTTLALKEPKQRQSGAVSELALKLSITTIPTWHSPSLPTMVLSRLFMVTSRTPVAKQKNSGLSIATVGPKKLGLTYCLQCFEMG